MILVRADVTYLRQDFSVMQPVKEHGRWPEMQRYDYLVRTRELSKEEIAEQRQKTAPCFLEHRQALTFALRNLTGTDAGLLASDWRRALSGDAAQASSPAWSSRCLK